MEKENSMSQFESPLIGESPKEWALHVQENFPAFLQDHAACERKAAALAMSFVAKYPDRLCVIEPMVALAREELEHFQQVYKIMSRMGIKLPKKDEKDHYVNHILQELRHGIDERFLDRLVMSGLVEARGYERFHLLSQYIEDPELKKFYFDLANREAGHYKIFINIAKKYFSSEIIDEAVTRIAKIEHKAMINAPIRATLH